MAIKPNIKYFPENCKCLWPNINDHFSICLNCVGQLRAFGQCLNCYHKGSTILGRFFCKSEGWKKVSEMKKEEHCAAQKQITSPSERMFIRAGNKQPST